MTTVDEIAPDLFRISTFIPEVNFHLNQFLVRDDEPLLYHTGMRWLFPAVRDAVARLIDPATLKWISFSHFESDECGSLHEWQTLAPQATAACGQIAKNVSVDDVVAARPARGLDDDEVFSTGKYRFRFLATPHVPHCWDAGLLFEETHGTLFCSDLLHQNGKVEPCTTSDVVGRFRNTLESYERGPFAAYMPYTDKTPVVLERLAQLEPKTLAVMHGSAYSGNGARAIRDMGVVLRDVLGPA
jgi:flavorubredoxin